MEKNLKQQQKKRWGLCGLSVFGVKKELKETAWRTVFSLKSLSCLTFTWLGVVLKLCYLPSAIICAKLVLLCCVPPVHPPFFPLTLLQWSGLWRCLSDPFSTASPKILLILLLQACNYCPRQSILLLSAYHGSCGCNIQLCVITSCLIFPYWLGKLFWDAVFSQPLGIWLPGRVLIMNVPPEWQSTLVLPCAVPSAAALPHPEGEAVFGLGVPLWLLCSGEEQAAHGLCP